MDAHTFLMSLVRIAGFSGAAWDSNILYDLLDALRGWRGET
jgi:hypothetical protein